MHPAFLVRFFPSGPWRIGPDSGARDGVESVLHSDALYSAVTSAMARLGLLEEWLAAVFATVDGPAVRFSSCYPFQRELLFVLPPLSLWPPAPSLRVRWKGARFVPVSVVEDLLAGRALNEDGWKVDGASRCLVPVEWGAGPFDTAVRSGASVDRLSGGVAPYRTACLEFRSGAGMWAVVAFADEEKQARWEGPLKAAMRLLGDSGLGGRRSCGWGRSSEVQVLDGALPSLVLRPEPIETPDPEAEPKAAPESAYWLLSLFSPQEAESVDWSRGNYSILTRGGRVESDSSNGAAKKQSRMVAEGSVLFAGVPPSGAALDVAPEGCAHPVYRAGFALAVSIPWREVAR
jgi:CRISPR type III-A-associated RAMP protein Csm4